MRYTFLLLVLGLAACRQPAEKLPNGEDKLPADIIHNPATASGQPEKTKGPAFTFAETRHHFGEIVSGEKVTHEFRFTNSGDADLVIANVRASCGCTVPEYSKEPVPPGGNGKITVTFDSSGKHGMQSKTITIIANTTPATRVLTISAEILSDKSK
jgi:hypothetical protein